MFLALGYNVLSFIGAFFMHIIFAKPYFAIEDCISSYFCSKKKVILESRVSPMAQMQPEELGAVKDNTAASTNGCVNVTYSKTLDGL